MSEPFADMLTVGGKSNSLGRVNEVIDLVLSNRDRLEELYDCLFHDDAWARMRAADAIEKICRERPDWIEPFIDRMQREISDTTQPSILWHLAQIYRQVSLNDKQRDFAIKWLKKQISTKDVDWIVAANTMDTLFQFTCDGHFAADELAKLLKIQLHHKSAAVVKRAAKLLDKLSNENP